MAGVARAGAILVLFAGLAACGDGDQGTEADGTAAAADAFCGEVGPRVDAWLDSVRAAAPAPSGERYGGTVTVGGLGELANGINAFNVRDYSARQHQQHVVLMTLVRYDADLEPRPWLAESWELSEDGTSLTFHLRDDVFWHDGEPTDAEDVAFTFRRLTDPETAFPNAASWAPYTDREGGVSVEVVDAHTVRFDMERHSEFLDVWTTTAIMPEHLLAEVPAAELGQHPFGTRCPVGNGPFVFAEHRPQDRWVFQANPAFPEELGGRPYVDRYVFRVIPEQATLLTELLTGEVDVYVSVPPDQAQRIEEAPDAELLSFDWPGFVFVAWNSRRPQLADPRVRRALTLGTDRRQIVDGVLRGFATVANSGVPPFHWAHDADGPSLEHDPERARALLDEAGWRDGDGDGVRENADGERLSVTIKYHPGSQQRQAIAEVMQSQLAEIGVEAEPRVVEYATLLEQIMTPGQRDFDGVVMSFVTEVRLDETDLFRSDRAEGPLGWSGIQSPRLDSLLDRLATTVDRDEARGVWSEYQAVLTEEQPYTWLYHPVRLDGVRSAMGGVVMDPRGEWASIKEWWLDPSER